MSGSGITVECWCRGYWVIRWPNTARHHFLTSLTFPSTLSSDSTPSENAPAPRNEMQSSAVGFPGLAGAIFFACCGEQSLVQLCRHLQAYTSLRFGPSSSLSPFSADGADGSTTEPLFPLHRGCPFGKVYAREKISQMSRRSAMSPSSRWL